MQPPRLRLRFGEGILGHRTYEFARVQDEDTGPKAVRVLDGARDFVGHRARVAALRAKDDVSALDVGPDVLEPQRLQFPSEVGHREPAPPHVDAAEQYDAHGHPAKVATVGRSSELGGVRPCYVDGSGNERDGPFAPRQCIDVHQPREQKMKVFITGATGYIGSSVARALAGAGHEILALAHREGAREELAALGYDTVDGDLTDPAGLARAARGAEATVHAANTNDERSAALDDAAVRAMVDALEGSGAGLVYTSGIWVLGERSDEPATEDATTDPLDQVAWRGPLERWLVEAADRRVRTVVIRPGVVYGGGGGLPGMMGRGELPLVGDGQNRWPLVHVDDLARLYVKAVESAPAGSILHGVADHVRAVEIAEHLDADSMPLEAAREAMGGFAEALALDQLVASRQTRALMEWEPREAGILES